MDIVRDTCPMPECNLTPRDVHGLLDRLATYSCARRAVLGSL